MLNPLAQTFQPMDPASNANSNGNFDIFQLRVVHEAIYAKEVAIATDKIDKSKKYFLKRMGKSCVLKAEQDWNRNEAERSLLNGTLKCHHLASYFGCHSDGLDYYVVSEYFEEGTLEDYIESDKLVNHHVNENLIMNWSMELIKGIFFLHTEDIIHKNLKPSNIYIRNKTIKIGDVSFDFSVSNRNLRSLLSSASYTSPEILTAIMKTKASSVKATSQDSLTQIFTFKSDIWALGCILYELITYSVAFEDLHSIYEYEKYNMHSKVNEVTKLDWNSLLDRMLVKDQHSRAGTFEVLVKIEALKKNTKCAHADFFDKNLGSIYDQQSDKYSKSESPKSAPKSKNTDSTLDVDENNNYICNGHFDEQPITSTFDEKFPAEYKAGLQAMNFDLYGNENEENLIQAYELVYEGNYWFDMGSAEKAIECYESALNLDQFNFKAMIGKCKVLEKFDKLNDVLDILDKILNIDKLNMDALIAKGYISLKLKNFAQGIECFSDILEKIDSKSLHALNGKAEAFFCLEKYKESILMFSKALSVSSEDITALLGIANVLYKVGRFKESADYYTKILMIDDRNLDFVLVRMGYLMIEMGQCGDAIKYFDQAIAKNPNNYNATIGKTYAQNKFYNSSRAMGAPGQNFVQQPLLPTPTTQQQFNRMHSPPNNYQNGGHNFPLPRPCELKPFDFNH